MSSFLNDQTMRENFQFVWDLSKKVWNNYGADYIKSIWNLIRNKLDPEENSAAPTAEESGGLLATGI